MSNIIKMFVSIIVITVLFASCGNRNINDYSGNSQAKSSKQNTNTKKIMSLDRVLPVYFDISQFDEENYANIFLGDNFIFNIKLSNQKFSMPAKLSDVQACGFKIADNTNYNKDSLIRPLETVKLEFIRDDGYTLSAVAYNSSESLKPLKDCYIAEFHIENDYYKDMQNYHKFSVNGIDNTMVISDIISTIGTPSHFYEISENYYYLDYFISKSDRRNGIRVYIDTTDDIITAIEFSYYK